MKILLLILIMAAFATIDGWFTHKMNKSINIPSKFWNTYLINMMLSVGVFVGSVMLFDDTKGLFGFTSFGTWGIAFTAIYLGFFKNRSQNTVHFCRASLRAKNYLALWACLYFLIETDMTDRSKYISTLLYILFACIFIYTIMNVNEDIYSVQLDFWFTAGAFFIISSAYCTGYLNVYMGCILFLGVGIAIENFYTAPPKKDKNKMYYEKKTMQF